MYLIFSCNKPRQKPSYFAAKERKKDVYLITQAVPRSSWLHQPGVSAVKPSDFWHTAWPSAFWQLADLCSLTFSVFCSNVSIFPFSA